MSGSNYLYFPNKNIAFYCNKLDDYHFDQILVDLKSLLKDADLEEDECYWGIADTHIKSLTLRHVSYLLECRDELNKYKSVFFNRGILAILIHFYAENDEDWKVVDSSDLPEDVIFMG